MSDDILRDLVDGEREAMMPPRGRKEATWAAVAQSVGEGATPPIDPRGIGAAPSMTSGIASWVKIVLVVALGGAGVVGVAAVTGGDDERPRVAASQPAAPRDAPPDEGESAAPENVAPEAVPAPFVDAAEPESATETEAAPAAMPDADLDVATPNKRESKRRAHAMPSSGGAARATAPASALAEEADLLAAAKRSLGGGAPDSALAKLAEHAQRFPHGQLTEDRIALRARALCRRGDVEQGRRVETELRAKFPRSSHFARIDRDCD